MSVCKQWKAIKNNNNNTVPAYSCMVNNEWRLAVQIRRTEKKAGKEECKKKSGKKEW